jgi:poly(hydroxyalkanoate) depolymerase family esterase
VSRLPVNLDRTLRQALQLMRSGDLQAATRAIQHGLARRPPEPGRPVADAAGRCKEHGGRRAAGVAQAAVLEGEVRNVDRGAPVDTVVAPGPDRGTVPAARGWRTAPLRARRPAPARPGDDAVPPLRRHSCEAGSVEYALHIPAGRDPAGAPLLVMLHGCTQSPEDFARGTRMNRLADQQGYVVAWPMQSAERNPNRCWNWFRDSDQQRGRGEPALLAALTRELIARHRLDARRVYAAGLSAGGAMAAVLASTHPDLYAAIGVHSGLPIGLASDVPSAFAAMHKGGGRRWRRAGAAADTPVPAIVFHGDVDATVHPANGHGVIAQSLGSSGEGDPGAGRAAAVERGSSGGRSYTRTVHRSAEGRLAAEHWVVHGAAHAWIGGDAAGSYADPAGPDASAQMLRFFAECASGG